MISISNQQALSKLRNYQLQEKYLKEIRLEKYPGLTLEHVFYLINTGVMVEGMNLDSTKLLLSDLKRWISKHSHGGLRERAGRKKTSKNLKNITLTAEAESILNAKKQAKEKYNSSLQELFRKWIDSI